MSPKPTDSPSLKGHHIGRIFYQEFVVAIRDSHTLASMILLPLLIYPIMALLGAGVAMEAQGSMDRTIIKVGVPAIFAPFEEFLATSTLHIEFYPPGQQPFLSDKGWEAMVTMASPSTTLFQPNSLEATQITIDYDMTRWQSSRAEDYLFTSLRSLSGTLVDARLASRSLPLSLVRPLKIESRNIAPPKKMGGYLLGRFLPGLILIFAMIGAFYPAIDLTAGEKERGTLETLLLAPIPLLDILVGKFLAVLTITLITIVLNLFSLALTMKIAIAHLTSFGMPPGAIQLHLSFPTLLLLFTSLVPFAATMTSLMMVVAFMARSFKEAQNYLNPLLFFICIPAFSNSIPGIELTPLTAIVPIANLAILFKELFLGHANPLLVILTLASTFFYSGLALLLALRLFSNKDIMLRESEDITHFLFPRPHALTAPTPQASLALFGIVLVLLFDLAPFLQNSKNYPLVFGLLIIQLLINLSPPLLYLWFFRYPIIPTLDLEVHKIRPINFLLLPFMGAALMLFILQWGIVQEKFFPSPGNLEAVFLDLFRANSKVAVFLVVSIIAPFCEEVLFRGFIQKGLRERLGGGLAVLVSALFFAIFHLSPQKFFTTFFLGLWMGYVFERTGSLWMSIYCHALNNGTICLLFFWGGEHLAARGASNLSLLPPAFLFGCFLIFYGFNTLFRIANPLPLKNPIEPSINLTHT